MPPDSEIVVGRAPELAVVAGLVTDLQAARGRSVLVEGEPGIGKSALLTACVEQARRAGIRVLRGSCDALDRAPLAVMRETLGLDTPPLEPPHTPAAVSQPSVGHPPNSGWSVPMPIGDPAMAAVEGLAALVDGFCAAGPLVVAVDDLHWADDVSLLLWRRLSRATVQQPLLLVGTCRPIPEREELAGLRRDLRSRDGVSIGLQPLADTDVGEVARRLTGGRPGPQLTERLKSAAGNPLYVREMLDAFTRAEVLAVAGGSAELTGLAAPGSSPASGSGTRAAPISDHVDAALASLAGAIADRLDFLSPDCRSVLQVASLQAADFAVSDVAGVVDRALSELLAVLAEALSAGVLEEAGTRLRFRHGLIKQALYESIPEPERAALYRQTAQALHAAGASAERVGEVISRSGESADAWEVGWMVDNAEALTRAAPQIAAELFERSLAGPAVDGADRELLEDHLLAVHYRLGLHEDIERIAARILAGDPAPRRAAQTAWMLGRSRLQTGGFDETRRLLADRIADPRTEPVWRARLTAILAATVLALGDIAASRDLTEQALQEAEQTADPLATAWALNISASAAMLADQDTRAFLAYLDRALAVTGTGTDPQLAAVRLNLLTNRVHALTMLSRFAEVPEALQQARALAEHTGAPQLSSLQIQAADFAYDQNRWDDALADLELIESRGQEPFRRMFAGGLTAVILLHQDKAHQARQHLDALRDEPAAGGYRLSAMAPLLVARALAAEQDDDPQLACRTLAVILTAEYEQAMHDRTNVYPVLVRWAMAAGYRATALRTVEVSEREAREDPTDRKRSTADWCRGLLDQDPDLVLAGAAHFRDTDRKIDQGNAMEDAAVLLAAAGRLDAAREAIDEALSAYSGLGARWDARRGARRLRPFGIRPNVRDLQQRPRTGWEALTATELRVAELVAEGRSNPDIADRLMLSRRTVETHVAHILAKLKARSRRAVADFAGPTPTPDIEP